MSVQNPELAGLLLTRNRSNFFYVDCSTAWLYDCPHFLSPLYKFDRCFDHIPIHFKDTLVYVDPITRQTYDYASHIACDNNSRNIFELDPDSDDQYFYILGPEPIKRKFQLIITPFQIKTTTRPLLSQLKMLAYTPMLNLIIFGTEVNILTLHFNF